MNIPNIDSKIMARAFALALAVEHRKALFMGNDKYSPSTKTVVDVEEQYEQYLICNANLHEVKEDPTKDWLETMKSIHKQQSIEEREKRDRDWKEFISTLPKPKITDGEDNE